MLICPLYKAIEPIKSGTFSGNIILLASLLPKGFSPSFNQCKPTRFSQPDSDFKFSKRSCCHSCTDFK